MNRKKQQRAVLVNSFVWYLFFEDKPQNNSPSSSNPRNSNSPSRGNTEYHGIYFDKNSKMWKGGFRSKGKYRHVGYDKNQDNMARRIQEAIKIAKKNGEDIKEGYYGCKITEQNPKRVRLFIHTYLPGMWKEFICFFFFSQNVHFDPK